MMSTGGPLSVAEIDERIAIVRDNIRQLIEQAAAASGAEDESRNADRIAQQSEELERLMKQRRAAKKWRYKMLSEDRGWRQGGGVGAVNFVALLLE